MKMKEIQKEELAAIRATAKKIKTCFNN